MIRDKNIDPDASFPLVIITQPVNVGASFDGRAVETRMPFYGKVIHVHFRCSQITDADDSVRVKPQMVSTDVVAAAVDPVAADTTTLFTLTANTFSTGAMLAGHVLTGAGDALVGTFTWVVRPYLGVAERVAAGLGES